MMTISKKMGSERSRGLFVPEVDAVSYKPIHINSAIVCAQSYSYDHPCHRPNSVPFAQGKIMLFLILVWFQLFCCPWAFSWSKPPIKSAPESGGTILPIEFDYDVSLGVEHANSLQLSYDALERYARRPDCFRRAAGEIRTRCGELDMGEDERINAAVSMTLCEIATAKHYSLPLECRPFLPEGVVEKGQRDLRTRSECVDALSRSAQFWSSYSGYLREIPQLCFAFRRWNDIDLARDIYKNATIEKITFLRSLASRERSEEVMIQKREDQLTEFRRLILQLQAATESYDVIPSRLASYLDDNLNHALALLKSTMLSSAQRYQVAEKEALSQLEGSLELVLHRHAEGIGFALSTLEASLIQHLDSVFERTVQQQQDLLYVTNEIRTNWVGIEDSFISMNNALTSIFHKATNLSSVIDDTLYGAESMAQIHVEASRSTSQLIETISLLTETTHFELEKFNASSNLLQQELLFVRQDSGKWWQDWIIRIAQIIFHAEGTSREYILHIPLVRFLISFLTLLWIIFRATFSALTSAILIIFFASRKVVKKSSPLTPAANFRWSLPSDAKGPDTHHLAPIPLSSAALRRYSTASALRVHPYFRDRPRYSRIPDRLFCPSFG